MRVVACCLPILGALVLCAASPVGVEAARCAPAASSNAEPVKSKPVSFAPRRGHRHVYGQPIQPPIFGRSPQQPRKPSSPPQP